MHESNNARSGMNECMLQSLGKISPIKKDNKKSLVKVYSIFSANIYIK